jgi:hypothetical protein
MFYGLISTFEGVNGMFYGLISTFESVNGMFYGLNSTFESVNSMFYGLNSTFESVNSMFHAFNGTFESSPIPEPGLIIPGVDGVDRGGAEGRRAGRETIPQSPLIHAPKRDPRVPLRALRLCGYIQWWKTG